MQFSLRKALLACTTTCLALVACTGSHSMQSSATNLVEFEVGGALYPHGDQVEIHSVRSNTGEFSAGAELTVRGSYQLHSKEMAILYFGITNNSFNHDGAKTRNPEEGAAAREVVARGEGEFELRHTMRSEKGLPHIKFYALDTGKPFGGAYFGKGKCLETNAPKHYAN